MKIIIILLLWIPVKLVACIPGKAGRAWHFSRLRQKFHGRLDKSNVILGRVEVEGTAAVHIGRHCLIYPGVVLETQGYGQITIGDYAVLSRGVHIVAHDRVDIGNGVLIGEYSAIRDANHRWTPEGMRFSGFESAPISIENNVWIGRCCTVLKGSHLKQGVVLAANSVQLTPSDPHSLYAGAPAILKKSLLTSQEFTK